MMVDFISGGYFAPMALRTAAVNGSGIIAFNLVMKRELRDFATRKGVGVNPPLPFRYRWQIQDPRLKGKELLCDIPGNIAYGNGDNQSGGIRNLRGGSVDIDARRQVTNAEA